MLEKIMASEEANSSNNGAFVQNQVGLSIPPPIKKKRNVPGNPGKLFLLVLISFAQLA